MYQVRKANDRGKANHGWLQSRHSFSFANYFDPSHMGFRALRVINEDRVDPGQGFGTHPHRDMEIISYVLDGALEHADSMGTGSVIKPGEVQRMSAGRGITHSEYNHSRSEPVHFLQIWIQPNQFGIQPSYEQIEVPSEEKTNKLRLVASPDGAQGSVKLHQDARLYTSLLDNGASVTFERPDGRHVWIQIARGKVRLGDQELVAGDGVATSDEREITLTGVEDAEILLFDLS